MDARKTLNAGVMVTEVSGLALVAAALVPGGAAWAAGMVLPGPVAADAAGSLALGIAGALLVGWSVTMFTLLSGDGSQKAAALGIARGIAAWFVLDCVVSATLGAYLNLAFNVFYLAMVGLPAYLMARQGQGEPAAASANA